MPGRARRHLRPHRALTPTRLDRRCHGSSLRLLSSPRCPSRFAAGRLAPRPSRTCRTRAPARSASSTPRPTASSLTSPSASKPRGTVDLARRPHGLRERPAEQRAGRRRPCDTPAHAAPSRSARRPKASASRPTAAGSSPRSRRPTRSSSSTGRRNARPSVVKVRGKNPEHAVFTPDGRYVFVSAEDGQAVDVVDVAMRAQVAQIPVGVRPARHRLLPRQPARLCRRRELERALPDRRACLLRAGAKSRSACAATASRVHPDGTRLYVSNGGDATVSVIDVAAPAAVATVRRGPAPLEHGDHARRAKALRRLRTIGQRLRHRHRAEREKSPTSRQASCHGASPSGDRAPRPSPRPSAPPEPRRSRGRSVAGRRAAARHRRRPARAWPRGERRLAAGSDGATTLAPVSVVGVTPLPGLDLPQRPDPGAGADRHREPRSSAAAR